ncbi:ornithine decarboxylase 1-like [Conger conger]|uniref:ornithine decarboxylase 1-like n=1 Tax=Conger conger TaxID=82655 RepID=UPI002A5A6DA0|nr:ornithine decarboxylase 1-like [Conger conger]XP_061099490.1 ornithine decarboxylase 1-like [Conger conger]
MSAFTPEDFGFAFLEDGATVQDVIEQRISELSKTDAREAFYVADLGQVVRRYLRWVRFMPRVTPFYAVKCNDSRPLVLALAALGTGFDCASEYEVELVKSLGVDSGRIIYANTCKQPSHLKHAAAQGIQMMTFDDEGELLKIANCYKDAKLVLRIETDDSDSMFPLSNKFGATVEMGKFLLKRAKELALDVIGVSFHVGSACKNPKAYTKAIADARILFDKGAELGCNMTLLDIGGGFPGYDIPDLFVFKEFAAEINPTLDKYFPASSGVRIISEPGRYFPSTVYTLAVNIIGKKVAAISEKEKQDSDGEDVHKNRMMYYVNDGIHGSFKFVLFPNALVLPNPCQKRQLNERTYSSTIFGQTCDGHDLIMEDFQLPELREGEWLLFHNMGAYTITTSTTFNGFQKPDIHYVMSRSMWQHIEDISAAKGLYAPEEEASEEPEICSFLKPGPARKLYEQYAKQAVPRIIEAMELQRKREMQDRV